MRALLLAILLAVALPARAQVIRTHDPAGAWRTVHTEHYRLHYPVVAEAWALAAAGQLETIRARVAEEVGYAPEQVVDIVVMDPLRMSNGFALPFSDAPRMGVFPTPPDANPAFGHYRSWAEELIVHEDAHLVHLLRPSRNPVVAFASGALGGTTPITTNAPGWVIEGYATVVEGRLTGMGRPNSDFRALLIRKLAQEGRLPTYGQLDGSDRWIAGAFRYQVGSAYLEWLEARAGEGALRDLWARMTAVRVRTFEEAFEGVFGDHPATLYGRFVAETTLAAMELERDLPVDEDTLWLDVSWTTGAPALSPDGEHLAVVRRPRTGPSTLAVYATADDPEVRERWEEDVAAMLETDPQDVAPVEPRAFPREPEHERVRNARFPGDPRWTRDGKALIFGAWSVGPDGFLRPDLYRWEPASGVETRITRGADLVEADPHPDGTWAVAVRTSWGVQQLVRVDLATGEWTPLTEPDPLAVYDDPRIDASGDRLLYLRHDEGWHLVLRDLDTGEEAEIVVPGANHLGGPAWGPDGETVYASVGIGGFVEVHAIPLDGSPATRLTHAPGGAATPAPTPDGEAMFYLSLDAEGLDVHRLALADAQTEGAVPASVAPVVPPPPPPFVEPPPGATVDPVPYGSGRWEPFAVAGLAIAPGTETVEVGLRLGDVVGRQELVVLGGVGAERGWRGLSLAWAYRGWPVHLGAEAYGVVEGGVAPVQRAGVSVHADLVSWAGPTSLGATLGVLAESPWGEGTEPGRGLVFLGAEAHPRWARRLLGVRADLLLRGRLGKTGTEPIWLAGEAGVEAAVSVDVVGLGVEVGGGRTSGRTRLERYRLGGIETAMVPRVWLWSRVLAPGVATTVQTGEAFTSERAFVDFSGLQIGVERHRLIPECAAGICDDPLRALLVSARTEVAIGPQGLARTPGLRSQAGVACAIEDPGAGAKARPCRDLDDWRAWIGLTWRP